MGALPKHREAIVSAAAVLFRRQGYAATGINEIAETSGAPKGSLYHYFPGGKDAIGEAAVRFAAARVTRTLEHLAEKHDSTASLVGAYGRMLAGWLAASDFRDGCPITTTLLEAAPQSAAISAAGAEGLRAWRNVITESLRRDGFAAGEAKKFSALALATIQGALILARAAKSDQPIRDAIGALSVLLRVPDQARRGKTTDLRSRKAAADR